MLDLSTAVLCDFAQVRDRLLFVSSGAVSRLYRQELPSPLGLMVGLVIEVPLEDAGMEHKLRAEVINRHGTVLATLENLFRVGDVGLFPHEVQQVPLVLSITGVRARTWGTHQVRLYLDDELVRALTLYVVPATGPQAVVRATPTQSRVDDDEGTVGGPTSDDFEGAPTDTPVPSEPAAEEPEESHQIVMDVEQPADDDVIRINPEDTGPVEVITSETPAPEPQAQPEAAPAPAPAPAPQEERADSPAWGQPAPQATIDAPPASEPAATPQFRTAPQSAPQADFDEDDLDADPADRPAPGDDDQSRFSFRYRYDDDA
jgi:hypothetical protein